MKKKEIILNTARTLFNDKGYHNVTIRMIALELNMSSGNLNYHFKKREDIFEALYFEMVSEFDQRIENLNTIEITLDHIRGDIKKSMQRMISYTFFWTDLYQLLHVSNKVKTHFQEVYTSRKRAYALLFEMMIKENLLQPPSYPLEYTFLADRMLSYGNTWLYQTSLYTEKLNSIELQVDTMLTMLYPFLTTKGKSNFKKLLPTYF